MCTINQRGSDEILTDHSFVDVADARSTLDRLEISHCARLSPFCLTILDIVEICKSYGISRTLKKTGNFMKFCRPTEFF